MLQRADTMTASPVARINCVTNGYLLVMIRPVKRKR
jgi:hypothetical protein